MVKYILVTLVLFCGCTKRGCEQLSCSTKTSQAVQGVPIQNIEDKTYVYVVAPNKKEIWECLVKEIVEHRIEASLSYYRRQRVLTYIKCSDPIGITHLFSEDDIFYSLEIVKKQNPELPVITHKDRLAERPPSA